MFMNLILGGDPNAGLAGAGGAGAGAGAGGHGHGGMNPPGTIRVT